MVTARQIEAVVDEIARRSKPERIILFGSYAYGTPTEDSDVDLLVVKRHRGHTADAASRMRPDYAGFPMDLLVRSPAEMRRRIKWGDYFILDIVEKGIILHEANNDRLGQKGRRRLRRRLHSETIAKTHPIRQHMFPLPAVRGKISQSTPQRSRNSIRKNARSHRIAAQLRAS